MDISHSFLLVLLLVIHGLVLQTCDASRKLPLMVEALDIHDMYTVEADQSTKLSAQMKVEIVRRNGKQVPIRNPSPKPNLGKIQFYVPPPAPTPTINP